MKSLKSGVIKGFRWSYIGIFSQVLLQLAVVSVLARLIEPKDFGIISISFVFINLVQLISQIGIGPALIQRKKLTEKHITSAFSFSLLLGGFIYIVFFFSAPLISSFFKLDLLTIIIRVISLSFVFQSLFLVSFSLLQKELRFKEITIIKIISYLIGYGIIGIVFAFLGYGVWALVFASLSQNLFRLFITIYFKPIKFKFNIYKKELMELLCFGGGFTLGRVFNYISLNGDNFIIGKMLNADLLGIYSRVYTIMTMPATYFASVFDKVLFPAMSQIQDRKEKLKEIFLNGSEIIFFLSTVVAMFFYKFSDLIIMILLGNKWKAAIPILKIFAFGIPFRATYKLSDALSRALGTVYERAWRQGLYAFGVVLGAYIGSFYDLKTVSLMVVFSLVLIYFLMLSLSIKALRINFKEIVAIHYASIMYVLFFLLCSTIFEKVLNKDSLISRVILFILLIMFSLAFCFILIRQNRLYSVKWAIKKVDNRYLNGILKIIK